MKTKRKTLQDLVTEQRQWMAEHGGTVAGYVARYGNAFGDGGEAIYRADKAELDRRVANATKAERWGGLPSAGKAFNDGLLASASPAGAVAGAGHTSASPASPKATQRSPRGTASPAGAALPMAFASGKATHASPASGKATQRSPRGTASPASSHPSPAGASPANVFPAAPRPPGADKVQAAKSAHMFCTTMLPMLTDKQFARTVDALAKLLEKTMEKSR
jgi:hypothetical protein